MERARIGEEIGRAVEHELRRLHGLSVLLHFAGGEDHPRPPRVLHQGRSQSAGNVITHNYLITRIDEKEEIKEKGLSRRRSRNEIERELDVGEGGER